MSKPIPDEVLRLWAKHGEGGVEDGRLWPSDLARALLELRGAVRGVLNDLTDDRYDTADVNPEFAVYRLRVERLLAMLPEEAK